MNSDHDDEREVSPWRRRLQRTGLVLAAILVTVSVLNLLGETVLVLVLKYFSNNIVLKTQLANPDDLGIMSLYVPDPYSLYIPRPSYRSANGLLYHNSHGCRADDVAVPKPPGVYRIVVAGGSTTYSTGVRENRNVFSFLLEKMLNEDAAVRHPDRRFEVVNCGVPGYTSAENLTHYIFSVSEYQPERLIVQQGLNDTLPRTLPTMSRDYREFSKIWEDVYVDSGRSFIMRLASNLSQRSRGTMWTQGINLIVRKPFWDAKLTGANGKNLEHNTPWVFESNTRDLIHLAKGNGATVVLQSEHLAVDPKADWRTMGWGRTRGTLEHNEVLRRLAGEEHTLFFDLNEKLGGAADLMPDGRHLNDAGDAKKARAMFQYLRGIL